MKPSSAVKYDPLDWAREKGSRSIIMQEMEAALRGKKKKRARKLSAATAVAAVLFVAFWVVPFVRQTSTIQIPAGQRQRALAVAEGLGGQVQGDE